MAPRLPCSGVQCQVAPVSSLMMLPQSSRLHSLSSSADLDLVCAFSVYDVHMG